MPPAVDVVVVAYRSARTLRDCVEPLAGLDWVGVTVVDNASPDDSAATVAGLANVSVLRSPRNGGFSYGCNLGSRAGTAPYLLFLNPDARIEPKSLRALVGELERHPGAALAGPRLVDEHGKLAHSLRRFPRLRSTFAQAVFLHRLRPSATWTDEVVRDPAAYLRPAPAQWLSGACLLARRDAYEAIGGFDERFFLYCEDTDLCLRLWRAGHEVRFVPAAEARHVGGESSDEGATRPIAARSRVLYARKHASRPRAALEAAGVALGESTHALVRVARPALRRSHVAALRAVAGRPARTAPWAALRRRPAAPGRRPARAPAPVPRSAR